MRNSTGEANSGSLSVAAAIEKRSTDAGGMSTGSRTGLERGGTIDRRVSS
jgi:hypothetical protein